MAYFRLPSFRDLQYMSSGAFSTIFLGTLLQVAFVDPNYVYDFINASSDDTYASMLALLVKQTILWSLYLETTPVFWETCLERTAFWNRYHCKKTREGALIHDEIRDGLMVSLQHCTSASTIIYGFMNNNYAFVRFGATAEIAYEINDIVTIVFNLSRNKTKPMLIKILLLLHHFLAMLSIPVFVNYLYLPDVQNIIMALTGSGAALCIMLPLQYIPNIRTRKGALTSFIMHSCHLSEFVYYRWYIGFGNNEWKNVVEVVEENPVIYFPFLGGALSMILFNTIVTLVFIERCCRSILHYVNAKD